MIARLRRILTGWPALDPAPEYSALDRADGLPRPRPVRHVPSTVELDRMDRVDSPDIEAARIITAEAVRREYALDTAIAEMMRPRLTTEAILDGYLALVIPAEERAA